MTTLEELTDLNVLNECTKECTKQSRWKETTQRYIANMLVNNVELQEEVRNKTYLVKPTTDFFLNERGHIRKIEAPVARDRVVQKSLMKHVLLPSLTPYLIYDNYASLKDRGTSFARKRLEIMLHRYFNENGLDGYVLLIDIKKYFESIDHEVLKQLIAPHIANEPKDVIDLIHYVIDTSSHTDKGINLGSECPQIFAVFLLNVVDTFVKVVRGVKYYGRYMDDIVIIAKTKEELVAMLQEIEQILSAIKLETNKKKTHIVKLSHGFTWLQIKYNILPTGKILKRPTHKKIVRERRRLKAFRRMLDAGQMTIEEIHNCYKSWRGTVIKDHNACYRTLHSLDKLYNELFPSYEPEPKRGRKELASEIYKDTEVGDLKEVIRLGCL